MVVVVAGNMYPALAEPSKALADTVISAFTPAQISALASTITGNVDPGADKDVQSLEHLQQILGVNRDVLVALLRILDRPDIRPEQSAKVLAQLATQYHSLTARLTEIYPRGTDEERLVAEMQAAMTAGNFSRTEALIWQIETRETAPLSQSASGTAPVSATQDRISTTLAHELLGELALMNLRYRDAADHFQKAAALLPGTAPDDRLRILTRRGDALAQDGSRYGDRAAFQAAATVYREVLGQWPKQRSPHEWAAIQNKLGLALNALGEQEPGTTSLEQAVAAFRAALEADTREDGPLDWAATLNNLGDSLRRLGNREGGTAQLEEAVRAYRTSLEERTRERVPLDWAATQHNLGLALDSLGQRGGGSACLREAVSAFRAALQERTRERTPREWAATQRNLGDVLSAIGQAEDNATPLQEAANAYRSALEVIPLDESPFQWGTTEFDLASALFQLGGRMQDPGRLMDALGGFEQAKAVFVKAKLDDLADSVTPVITTVKQSLALLHAEPNPTEAQTGAPAPRRVSAEHTGHGVTADRPPAIGSLSSAPDIVPAKEPGSLPTADSKPPLPQLDLGLAEQPEAVPPIPHVDLVRPIAPQEKAAGGTASDPTAAKHPGTAAAVPGIVSQPQTGLPAADGAAKPTAVGHALSTDMLALLLSRGDALLALGDLSSARLLYERAAAEGDARAAVNAGRTLDPLFLSEIGARGIHADPEAAAAWYRRAIELGDQSAAERLRLMRQTTAR
jgi:tetratricopeptide (TPR) repeat protein